MQIYPRRLSETNLEALPGYGTDTYCSKAKEKIKKACGLEDAVVEFLVGGTQTNAVVISTMLAALSGKVVTSFWEKYDETHIVVRFATSWSTTEEDLAALEVALEELQAEPEP